MDKLTSMAVFAQVVEANSFTSAAAQLGMSRSAVSKAIAGLEDRLGARLLNRTTRRLALTEVGQAFYEHCARIVAEAEDAELAVSHLQVSPRGTLRVNAPVSFGLRHLAPALPDFMKRYPEVRVSIDLADRMVDLIDEGYDLAVRIGDLQDSSLIARRLIDNHMVVCAAPAYWQRRGKPKEPSDLTKHACLTYAYQRNPNDWPFVGPNGRFHVRVEGPLQSNNGDLSLAAACAGLGVVVLPCFLCGEELEAGRLEPVLCDWLPPAGAIHAVYPHARHLSAKVRAFIDFLVERFAPLPAWEVARRAAMEGRASSGG